MFEALRDIRLGLAALLLLFIFGYFGFFEPASENEAKKPAIIPVYRHKNAYAVDEALIPRNWSLCKTSIHSYYSLWGGWLKRILALCGYTREHSR